MCEKKKCALRKKKMKGYSKQIVFVIKVWGSNFIHGEMFQHKSHHKRLNIPVKNTNLICCQITNQVFFVSLMFDSSVQPLPVLFSQWWGLALNNGVLNPPGDSAKPCMADYILLWFKCTHPSQTSSESTRSARKLVSQSKWLINGW